MRVEFPGFNELARRVQRLEEQLDRLSCDVPRFYSVSEFAERVRRAPYSVREWARMGRIRATRRATGRGPYREWVISHAELERYQEHGLLPVHSSQNVQGDG